MSSEGLEFILKYVLPIATGVGCGYYFTKYIQGVRRNEEHLRLIQKIREEKRINEGTLGIDGNVQGAFKYIFSGKEEFRPNSNPENYS